MVSPSRTNSGSSQETRSPLSSFETLCHKSAGLKKLSFRSAYAPSGTGNANAHLWRQRFVSLTQIRPFRVLCFPIGFLDGVFIFLLSLPSYYAYVNSLHACVNHCIHTFACLHLQLNYDCMCLAAYPYMCVCVCVVSSWTAVRMKGR